MKQSSLNLSQMLADMDLTSIKTQAYWEDRSWGTLFHNGDNPNQYFTNHAHIEALSSADGDLIADEVIAFYRERGLAPRVFFYNVAEVRPLVETFERRGFVMEERDYPYMRWDGSTFADGIAGENADIEVKQVDGSLEQAFLSVVCSIEEFSQGDWVRLAFLSERKNPNYRHYVLLHQGRPAAVGQIVMIGDQVQIESVATLSAYRGKGLAGHLIGRIQRDFLTLGKQNLGLQPANDQVERLYQRYGFETMGKTVFLMGVLQPDATHGEGK